MKIQQQNEEPRRVSQISANGQDSPSQIFQQPPTPQHNTTAKCYCNERRVSTHWISVSIAFMIIWGWVDLFKRSMVKFNLKYLQFQPCCMYVYDDFTDIHNYSMFKREVETPYWMKTNSDAFNRFVGGTTPKKFPLFTEKEDQVVNKKVKVQSKPKNPPEPQPPQSVVFVRQYFWPLFLPDQFNNHPYETLIRNNELHQLHYPIGHTTPCVMRQIAIPIDAYCSNRNDINTYQQHPQVIETHSWVPWWMLRWRENTAVEFSPTIIMC